MFSADSRPMRALVDGVTVSQNTRTRKRRTVNTGVYREPQRTADSMVTVYTTTPAEVSAEKIECSLKRRTLPA